MPRTPKRPCRYPGCPNLCDKGVYCSQHMQFSSDRMRGGAESLNAAVAASVIMWEMSR